MPVDKFGRMCDAKTRNTGVSLTYINNNYVRSDGGTAVSGTYFFGKPEFKKLNLPEKI